MHNTIGQHILQEFSTDGKIKFLISEYELQDNKPDSIQSINSSIENGTKCDLIKIAINLELTYPSLITGLNLIPQNNQSNTNIFKFAEIEGFNPDENIYFKLIEIQEKIQNKDGMPNLLDSNKNILTIYSYGITKNLRISFNISKKIVKDHNNIYNGQEYLSMKENFNSKSNPFDDLRYTSKDQENSNPEIEDKKVLKVESKLNNEYEHNTLENLFHQAYENIQILGYSLYSSPVASQVITLLNISNIFRKNNQLDEAVETDILFGLSLINARRFLQAGEILHKASLYFANKSEDFKIINQTNAFISRKDYTHIRDSTALTNKLNLQKDQMNSTLLNYIGYIGPNSQFKFIVRAAKLELLIADAINQHSMINEKVEALQRAVEYYSGQKNILGVKISQNYDIYTALLKLCPILCKLIEKCLCDKLEPLRIAAIRIIEFLIERVGCSIGIYLPRLFKFIMMTYPCQNIMIPDLMNENTANPHTLNPFNLTLNTNTNNNNTQGNNINHKNDKFSDYQQGDISANQNIKLMTDVYNHLLENLLHVLPSCSANILHIIFHELLIPNIFLQDINQDLKIYFLRLAEKIISLCQGDLLVNNIFFANIISILNSSLPLGVKLAANKLWETIKMKLVENLDTKTSNKLIDWISETIYHMLENDNFQAQTFNNLELFLELIIILNNKENGSKINMKNGENINNSIEGQELQTKSKTIFHKKNITVKDLLNIKHIIKPLILILEYIVNNENSKLEMFKKVWNVLIDLLNDTQNKQNDINIIEIALPLLWKVCKYCQFSSPSLPMLNFLILVLSNIKDINESMQDFLKEFISVYTECIPHSVYDESFEVFDILMKLSKNILCENLMKKCIMALIDQFTMKNKSQKQAKQNFISLIINHDSLIETNKENTNNLFYIVIKICLLENKEPSEEFTQRLDSCVEKQTQITTRGTNQQNFSIQKTPILHDPKQFAKLYEAFIDKLTFAYETLLEINESNLSILYTFINDGTLQSVFERLINSGNSKVRIKCLNMLRTITEAYIKKIKFIKFGVESTRKNGANLIDDSPSITNIIADVDGGKDLVVDEYITLPKLLYSRFAFNILKLALENYKDPKIQYHGLQILCRIFETFFQYPKSLIDSQKYQNVTPKKGDDKLNIIDIESINPNKDIKVNYNDENYIHLRLQQIFKFWPLVQNLTNSVWSSIRNISFGLICKWVVPDINAYRISYQKKLKSFIFTLLMSLLTSRESDVRFGGLCILGSLCGFQYDFDSIGDKLANHLKTFQRMANTISLAIWEVVFDLQKDWNFINKEAAAILIQLAAPRDSIHHFYKLKKEGHTLKFQNNFQNQFYQQMGENMRFNTSNFSLYSTGRDAKNRSQPNLNEDSMLNFSNVLKNINVQCTNFKVDQKLESPIDIKGTSINADPIIAQLPRSAFKESNLFGETPNSNLIHDFGDYDGHSFKNSIDDSVYVDELADLFWLENSQPEVLKEAMSIFKLDIKYSTDVWLDDVGNDYENKASLGDENNQKLFFEADEIGPDQNLDIQKINSDNGNMKLCEFNKKLQEDIEFEELGIIELEDDEEWTEFTDNQIDLKQEGKNFDRTSKNLKELIENGSSLNNSSKKIDKKGKSVHNSIQNKTTPTENSKMIYENYEDFLHSQQKSEDCNHATTTIEKIPLRPQNLIFRPLTPPAKSPRADLVYSLGTGEEEPETIKKSNTETLNKKRNSSKPILLTSKIETDAYERSNENRIPNQALINDEENSRERPLSRLAFYDRLEPPDDTTPENQNIAEQNKTEEQYYVRHLNMKELPGKNQANNNVENALILSNSEDKPLIQFKNYNNPENQYIKNDKSLVNNSSWVNYSPANSAKFSTFAMNQTFKPREKIEENTEQVIQKEEEEESKVDQHTNSSDLISSLKHQLENEDILLNSQDNLTHDSSCQERHEKFIPSTTQDYVTQNNKIKTTESITTKTDTKEINKSPKQSLMSSLNTQDLKSELLASGNLAMFKLYNMDKLKINTESFETDESAYGTKNYRQPLTPSDGNITEKTLLKKDEKKRPNSTKNDPTKSFLSSFKTLNPKTTMAYQNSCNYFTNNQPKMEIDLPLRTEMELNKKQRFKETELAYFPKLNLISNQSRKSYLNAAKSFGNSSRSNSESRRVLYSNPQKSSVTSTKFLNNLSNGISSKKQSKENSPKIKEKMMKTILTKAANVLKNEQYQMNEVLDEQERMLRDSGLNLNSEKFMHYEDKFKQMNDLLMSLNIDKSNQSRKRSISAEKGASLSNYNLKTRQKLQMSNQLGINNNNNKQNLGNKTKKKMPLNTLVNGSELIDKNKKDKKMMKQLKISLKNSAIKNNFIGDDDQAHQDINLSL